MFRLPMLLFIAAEPVVLEAPDTRKRFPDPATDPASITPDAPGAFIQSE